MGFLKKHLKQKDREEVDEDPEWAELKKFRENQKRSLLRGRKGPGAGKSVETGSDKVEGGEMEAEDDVRKEQSDEKSKVPIRPLHFRSEPNHEYQCMECNLKFKESWNRCPKCGGNVEPVGPDRTEDARELYPPHVPSGATPGTATGMAKTAMTKVVTNVERPKTRIVKKVKRPAAQPQPRKKQNQAALSHGKVIGLEGQPPSVKSVITSQTDLDDLFAEDPLLDSSTVSSRTPVPLKKRSWKDVLPITQSSHHTHAQSHDHSSHHPNNHPQPHTPPPEVRSMLNVLMDSESPDAGKQKGADCENCGYFNPGGKWDFCMRCGSTLGK